MSHLTEALVYARSGLSVLPVVLKQKKPTIKWSEFQKRIAREDELQRSFEGLNGNHGIAIICGEVSGGLEVLDFDNHFGDIDDVFEEFRGYEEVKQIIEKYSLPFEKSPNGGYHLFYRCNKIEGNKKLAERRNESSGNRLETIIETRGEGGYVIVSPSEGYELVSGGGLESIERITEQERAVLHSYARTFCKKESTPREEQKDTQNTKLKRVELGQVTNGEEKESIPRRYNREASEDETRSILQEFGWIEIGANKENYLYRRPGKKEGVSATFNGNVFYCFSTNGAPFDQVKGYSKYDVFLRLKHKGVWQDAYDELKARFGISKINTEKEQNSTPGEEPSGARVTPFFIRVWNDDSGRTQKNIDFARYVEFLVGHGFRKFKRDNEWILVRVTDNLVEEVDISDIQSFVMSYILENIQDRRVLDVAIGKDAIWTKSKTNFLDQLPDEFMMDTKNEGWLYYRNIALRVSKDSELVAFEYSELPKPIWKKKRIDRELDLGQLQEDGESEFGIFISKVVKNDEKRKNGMMRAIGYLLHGFKDPSNAKVIVFQDEAIPTVRGMANGGTGKSLVAQFVSTYKKIAYKGANLIQKEKTEFLFDTVDPETEIVQFDDANEHFPFDMLFSYVTGGLEVNKKYKQRIVIPKEKSPKFLITTNFTVGHLGYSHERRKHTVEFSDYYGGHRNPQDEFGHNLIDDWDSAEQHRADRFVIQCLRMFLRDGLSEECVINAKIRQLFDKVGREFAQFFIGKMQDNTILPNIKFDRKALYDEARLEVDELSELTLNGFTRKVKLFCTQMNINFFERRSNNTNYMVLVGDLERVKKMIPKSENEAMEEPFRMADDGYAM
ncbi:MAG: bifunctional DNA primase/polymerase [Ignavibacteriales bacterium]|nr:bifunctional DNA primase/polymerase [Ignavibacteriales bacterium]